MPDFERQIEYRRIDALAPDSRNPRLPLGDWSTDDPESEQTLLTFIARHYDALTLAESIAEFGYFPSEPLIVVEEEGSARPIVVEGNRRLAALRALTDAELRESLPNGARWAAAAEKATIGADEEIPVIKAESREAVAPLIGYRHISGVLTWDAHAKARFVAGLVNQDGHTFEEAADLVGMPSTSVRGLYRNFAILQQAKQVFDLNTASAEGRFGVFTSALNRRALREFLQAPAPGEVDVVGDPGNERWPVPAHAKDRLEEFLGWLYGTAEEDRVIEESRDLGRLAAVVASEQGLAELRASRDLDVAEQAAGVPASRVLRQLQQAANALEAAERLAEEAALDEAMSELLDRCEEALKSLRAALSNEAAAD